MPTQTIPLPVPPYSQRGVPTLLPQTATDMTEQTSGDTRWDALLAMSESAALILQMEAELEQDILDGNIEEGGFADND